METTINSFLKQNGLAAAALSVLIYLQAGAGGDIQDLRGDIQNLHGDIQTLRTEMAEGHQEIRAELVKGDQAIRAEMTAGDQSIRAEVSALGERIARVETRLTSVERILYADLDPLPQ